MEVVSDDFLVRSDGRMPNSLSREQQGNMSAVLEAQSLAKEGATLHQHHRVFIVASSLLNGSIDGR